MPEKTRYYLAIDLKSFYASVECVERGLDPLNTHLVVADKSRSEKTICLAVSPSLKAYGTGGRPRLFEVVQRVRVANGERRGKLSNGIFTGSSFRADELAAHPDLELDYITATPRMALYIKYSARIYGIYLKYVAPESIHVYSIDEVFMDVTEYLELYKMTAHELAMTMIRDVLAETGITATAGIGTNMYLAKVAMDIVAKHVPADKDGVRIAELDEMRYRQLLWNHRPITAFWRVGRGIAARLAQYGIDTMGKLARCSLENEGLLYHLFGVNAELLIDHAWGWEPCTMDLVKAYHPENHSVNSGQVLSEPYTVEKARVVIREMAENMAFDLFDKNLVTSQISITIGYDRENLVNEAIRKKYKGAVVTDYYGRAVPKHSHGSLKVQPTASFSVLRDAATVVFDRVVNKDLLIRRLNIVAMNVVHKDKLKNKMPVQLELFPMEEESDAISAQNKKRQEAEERLVRVVNKLKEQYGKNIVLHGLNFSEGATARERNRQIGGHKA